MTALRVLVTGASGFIGRQVAAALAAGGAEVLRVSRTPRAGWLAADLLAGDQGARLVHAARPDAIVHCAWCVEPGTFWTDPANEPWADASIALARAAAQSGVARFVGLGTCWEYAWPAAGDCVEHATPLAVHTPYDAAKARFRDALAAIDPLRSAWARLFFLYGAGEDPRRLVAGVARALKTGDPAACSRGLAVRDFLDVAEAGRAIAALTRSDVTGAVNIGAGEGVRIADLATRLGTLAGRPDLIRLGALPDRADEPPRIVADTRRLREDVGYRPAAPDDASLRAALAAWGD